jgi:tetratricopeptide (TPR) repeat protein
MTMQKEAEILDEKIRQAQAASDMAKARSEDSERRLAIESQREERAARREEAAQRLAAGDPKGALENLDSIWRPSKEGTPHDVVEGADAEKKEPKDQESSLGSTEKVEILALRGAALDELGEHAEAVSVLESALKIDPLHHAGLRYLGKAFFHQKKWRAALEAWKPLLETGAREVDLLSLVAEARYEVGKLERDPAQTEGARIAMAAVLLSRPADKDVLRRLAYLEYESDRPQEAMRQFQALLSENPLEPEYLEMVGNCWIRLGDRARALDTFELSAGVRAPGKEVALTLGSLYREQGFPGRAAEWLARAYKNQPTEAPSVDRLAVGRLFAAAGRGEEALPWLEAVGANDSEYAESQSRLVPLLVRSGKADAALMAYEKSRKMRPQDGESHLAAGRVYADRKQYDLALEAYARASGLSETKAAGLAGLGDIAYARKSLDSALQYYRTALLWKPGDARYLAAAQQISEEVDLLAPSGAGPRGVLPTGERR